MTLMYFFRKPYNKNIVMLLTEKRGKLEAQVAENEWNK